jgi:hypothetical protein
VPHPSNQLKHLVVDKCPLLQVIELSCGPTMLEYTGTMAPLIFGSTSRLKNICINFKLCNAILDYMVTGFPSTLPSLETLTLHCAQWKVSDMSSVVLLLFDYFHGQIQYLFSALCLLCAAENYFTRKSFHIYSSSAFEVRTSSIWQEKEKD